MAYEISWQQTNRIIYGRIYGDNTLEDVDHWSQDIVNYLETGIEPVHLVIDTTKDDLQRAQSFEPGK